MPEKERVLILIVGAVIVYFYRMREVNIRLLARVEFQMPGNQVEDEKRNQTSISHLFSNAEFWLQKWISAASKEWDFSLLI